MISPRVGPSCKPRQFDRCACEITGNASSPIYRFPFDFVRVHHILRADSAQCEKSIPVLKSGNTEFRFGPTPAMPLSLLSTPPSETYIWLQAESVLSSIDHMQTTVFGTLHDSTIGKCVRDRLEPSEWHDQSTLKTVFEEIAELSSQLAEAEEAKPNNDVADCGVNVSETGGSVSIHCLLTDFVPERPAKPAPKSLTLPTHTCPTVVNKSPLPAQPTNQRWLTTPPPPPPNQRRLTNPPPPPLPPSLWATSWATPHPKPKHAFAR